MKKILIAAVDNNWAIGYKNHLLFNIKEDMEFFRETTTHEIVIYGYNTLLSFPNKKPLKNRINIVLTSKDIQTTDDLYVAHSLEEVDKILKTLTDNETAYICGGASIYKQYVDKCEEAYITKINETAPLADVYFPDLDIKPNWKLISTLELTSEHGTPFSINRYINTDIVELTEDYILNSSF